MDREYICNPAKVICRKVPSPERTSRGASRPSYREFPHEKGWLVDIKGWREKTAVVVAYTIGSRCSCLPKVWTFLERDRSGEYGRDRVARRGLTSPAAIKSNAFVIVDDALAQTSTTTTTMTTRWDAIEGKAARGIHAAARKIRYGLTRRAGSKLYHPITMQSAIALYDPNGCSLYNYAGWWHSRRIYM